MNKIKPVKIYFLFFLCLFITSLIYLILLKKGIFVYNDKNLIKHTFIIGILNFFILGIFAGNNKQNKGLFFGFIYGFIFLIILGLINFLNNDLLTKNFIVKSILYLISSSIGGIIGVNIKKFI